MFRMSVFCALEICLILGQNIWNNLFKKYHLLIPITVTALRLTEYKLYWSIRVSPHPEKCLQCYCWAAVLHSLWQKDPNQPACSRYHPASSKITGHLYNIRTFFLLPYYFPPVPYILPHIFDFVFLLHLFSLSSRLSRGLHLIVNDVRL